MAVYMISYDIEVADSFEYSSLYEAIAGISGDWSHPLESVWFVDTTTMSASDIMNKLRPHLTIRKNGGDKILIIRCTDDVSAHYESHDVDWINSPSRTWNNPPY